MLDFILSKLNLLILVTAIFAIVSFFAFSLSDIAKVKEAAELVSKIKEKSFALASSPSYCLSDGHDLPGDLSIAGGSFYYVMKISKRQLETAGGDNLNVLIFSLYQREEIKKSFDDSTYEAKAIAANSFRTSSELHLYGQDYDGTDYSGAIADSVEGKEEIFVDPQATNPVDSVEFIKEIEGGEGKLYVIGCSSAACLVHKTTIGEQVHVQSINDEGGFKC
ncbi:MAG TPA: hypothetical protein VJG83_00680 [archaeon]|nr:hypothetical protein [archaeon]